MKCIRTIINTFDKNGYPKDLADKFQKVIESYMKTSDSAEDIKTSMKEMSIIVDEKLEVDSENETLQQAQFMLVSLQQLPHDNIIAA